MNVTAHFNVNNVELELPALPAGANWNVREHSYDDKGVWLILDLFKTVSYPPLINIFRDFFAMNTARPVLVSSSRVAYYHYASETIGKRPSTEQVHQAFKDVSAKAYLEAFPETEKSATAPKPHSIYVGKYNE